MSLLDFAKDNPVIFGFGVAVAAAGALAASPLFGAVGTLSAAGCWTAEAVGVGAALVEEARKS